MDRENQNQRNEQLQTPARGVLCPVPTVRWIVDSTHHFLFMRQVLGHMLRQTVEVSQIASGSPCATATCSSSANQNRSRCSASTGARKTSFSALHCESHHNSLVKQFRYSHLLNWLFGREFSCTVSHAAAGAPALRLRVAVERGSQSRARTDVRARLAADLSVRGVQAAGLGVLAAQTWEKAASVRCSSLVLGAEFVTHHTFFLGVARDHNRGQRPDRNATD